MIELLEKDTGVKIWGACKDLVGYGRTEANWMMTKDGEKVKDWPAESSARVYGVQA